MQTHIPSNDEAGTPETIQYLQSLRFLYVEALRRKQNGVADVLEKALTDLANVLKNEKTIQKDDPLLFEILFLNGFRRLDYFEKVDLLKLLEEDSADDD